MNDFNSFYRRYVWTHWSKFLHILSALNTTGYENYILIPLYRSLSIDVPIVHTWVWQMRPINSNPLSCLLLHSIQSFMPCAFRSVSCNKSVSHLMSTCLARNYSPIIRDLCTIFSFIFTELRVEIFKRLPSAYSKDFYHQLFLRFSLKINGNVHYLKHVCVWKENEKKMRHKLLCWIYDGQAHIAYYCRGKICSL